MAHHTLVASERNVFQAICFGINIGIFMSMTVVSADATATLPTRRDGPTALAAKDRAFSTDARDIRDTGESSAVRPESQQVVKRRRGSRC